jgi:predicted RNase H-like nuclease
MNKATFIGVDLAWSCENNSSGVALLRGDRQGAELEEVSILLASAAALAKYIFENSTEPTIVAVDAPLIIHNQTGQRPCETLIGKKYGDRGASCHSSNLSIGHCVSGIKLAEQLTQAGFRHAPAPVLSENHSVVLEVYPHPAILEFFSLPKIVKYKKGHVAEKQAGLKQLQNLLRGLPTFEPSIAATPRFSEFLSRDTNSLRGAALKGYEDQLDALLCSYIAYHYWYWGARKTEVFGNLDSGYIMVPHDIRAHRHSTASTGCA